MEVAPAGGGDEEDEADREGETAHCLACAPHPVGVRQAAADAATVRA